LRGRQRIILLSQGPSNPASLISKHCCLAQSLVALPSQRNLHHIILREHPFVSIVHQKPRLVAVVWILADATKFTAFEPMGDSEVRGLAALSAIDVLKGDGNSNDISHPKLIADNGIKKSSTPVSNHSLWVSPNAGVDMGIWGFHYYFCWHKGSAEDYISKSEFRAVLCLAKTTPDVTLCSHLYISIFHKVYNFT
jgi:hypothetical protein